MMSENLQSACLVTVGIVLASIHIFAELADLQRPWLQSFRSLRQCFQMADGYPKQVRDMMNDVSLQRFTSGCRAIFLVVSMQAVFHLIRHISADASNRQMQTQQLIVSLSLYALNILTVYLKLEWTHARMKASIALVNVVLLVDWSLNQDSEVFVMQQSARFSLLLLTGFFEMDHQTNAAWTVLFCINATWKHLQMVQSWPVEMQSQSWPLIVAVYIMTGMSSWTLCFLCQVWLAERCRACLQLMGSMTMVSRLLSVFCDAEVHLGHDLQIVGSHEKFSNVLTEGRYFEGASFVNFLAESDQQRFKTFVHSSVSDVLKNSTQEFSTDCSRLLPSVLHVHLRDCTGRTFPARIFHSAIIAFEEDPCHVLGICVDSADPCTFIPSTVTDEGALHSPTARSSDTGEADGSEPSSVSSDPSVESALPELDIIFSVHAFEPDLPVQSCTFQFTHPDKDKDVSKLPKVADWLKPADFTRLFLWVTKSVNQHFYQGAADLRLERVQMRVLGINLRMKSVDCTLDCDSTLRSSEGSGSEDHDRIAEDAKTVTEDAEALTPLVQLHVKGISGYCKLFRRVQKA